MLKQDSLAEVMLELVILQNKHLLFVKPLEELITIGGSPSCHVCLPDCPPHIQATLSLKGDQIMLCADQGEVRYKGSVVTSISLLENDTFEIDGYAFQVVQKSEAQKTATVTLYRSQKKQHDEMPLLTFLAASASTYCQPRLVLGRNVDCDYIVPDTEETHGSVSRHHAEIIFRNGSYYLRDLQSKNGTYLESHRIEEQKLPLRGRIQLGNFPLPFLIDEKTVTTKEKPEIIIPALNPHVAPKQLVGSSAALLKLVEKLQRIVATPDKAVFILGEMGTGKELVARYLHFYDSKRKKGPFVAINCAAIPHQLAESQLFGHSKGAFTGANADFVGVFREAHQGTLFLDEIAELPFEMQSKLLRVLEEKVIRPLGSTKDIPIDVRVVLATNQDVAQLCREKKFREDLYHRCHWQVQVPTLRERLSDLPELLDYFLSVAEADLMYEKETLQQLLNYPWPGNIRELSAAVDRAMVNAQCRKSRYLLFTDFELPQETNQNLPSVNYSEFSKILASLKRNRWNITEAINDTKIPRTSFYRKLRAFNIDPEKERFKQLLSDD